MREEIVSFLRTKNIDVPGDVNEISNLFLGALVVGKVDYWVDRSFDFIDNPAPAKPFEREHSIVAQTDNAYRASFANLDDETKGQLKKLLLESVQGVVFSILAELDENWTVNLESEDITATANAYDELHDDFYKWIELFGKNK